MVYNCVIAVSRTISVELVRKYYKVYYCLGQSGEVKSKYCTTSGAECFGSEGQNVYVKFARKFKETPKVMIGLTLIDTNKDQNVRVRAEVTHVTRIGFNIRFKPWDKSITYQIGVNWMACL